MQFQSNSRRSRPPRALDQCKVRAELLRCCFGLIAPREARSHKIAALDTTGLRECRRAHTWRGRGVGCRGHLVRDSPDGVRTILFLFMCCAAEMVRSSSDCAFECWRRRRQNFSGKGAAVEKVPASMASTAMSKAADAVVASIPVTNCQILLLGPVKRGRP